MRPWRVSRSVALSFWTLLAVAGCNPSVPVEMFVSPLLIVTDRVTIKDGADAEARRAALITKVWGSPTLDTSETNLSVKTDIPSPLQPPPANLARVDKYAVSMKMAGGGGLLGRADHYIPAAGLLNKLVILNPGHACSYNATNFGVGRALAELVKTGFGVLATYMPRNTPEGEDCDPDSYIPDGSHDQLFKDPKLRPPVGTSMRYFLDTIRRSLNYVQDPANGFAYTDLYIAGLSGGGWTAMMYPALDTRIARSVAVAGSLPFTIRNPGLNYYDLESSDDGVYNDFYEIAAFKDLYVLAAYGPGRRHVQVLNRHDDCCYGEKQAPQPQANWEKNVRAYEAEVKAKIAELGQGLYRLEIDESATTHEISQYALSSILLAELNPGGAALDGGAGDAAPASQPDATASSEADAISTDSSPVVPSPPSGSAGGCHCEASGRGDAAGVSAFPFLAALLAVKRRRRR